MKSRTLVASLVVWVCSLLLAALLSPSAGRASGGSILLQNPGFEEGSTGWSFSPQDATFTVTNTQVYSGSWAASLNRTDGVGGDIDIYQDVEGIIGGMSYALSGWATCNSNFTWVKLRIEWRNASGEVESVDSDSLTEDQEEYQFLTIPKQGEGGSVHAPPNATVARIKCMAYIHDSNPETPIFFDDLSFTFQGLSSKVYLPLVAKNY